MAIKPPVQWAQRRSQIFLRVAVSDLKDVKFDLNEEKNTLSFSGTSNGKEYAFEIEFFDAITKEGSVHAVHGNGVDMIIAKKETKEHWPRLTKDKTKLNWLSVDWRKYIDEEEETSAKSSFDLSGFDPSQMGDFMQNYDGSAMDGVDLGDDDDDDADMNAAD